MSRVAKNPISIPSGIEVKLDEKAIIVSGSKGKSEFAFPESVSAIHADDFIKVSYDESSPDSIALAGTTRSLINNMVIGVSDGFEKELEIIGVGYQASLEGKRLRLQIGYSHDIYFELPEDIEITADRTVIKINGIDKQLVGSVASKIRSFRKPEPYKGKGIRYKDENIIIKQGKTVGE